MVLSDVEMVAWAGLVNKAVTNSVSGLSGMVGQEMSTTALKAGHMSAKAVSDLFGGPDTMMISVHLGFEGSATGHMILAYQPKTAYGFIDLIMGQEMGSTNDLGDLEKSALQEMGNIMGGFFLNTIADMNGIQLCPTPPVTMINKASIVLNAAMSRTVEDDEELLLVDAQFGTHDQQIEGRFLVMPSPHLMGVLRQCWGS